MINPSIIERIAKEGAGKPKKGIDVFDGVVKTKQQKTRASANAL